MLTARLRGRVASARALEPARLEGHVLRFHKRGLDGSGKCNALRTRSRSEAVLGVVFEMDAVGRPALDEAEGHGRGYRRERVRVRMGEVGEVGVFTYVAESASMDEDLLPFDWYKALVLAGAREHHLPRAYVRAIERVAAQPDSDPERAARHFRLLEPGE